MSTTTRRGEGLPGSPEGGWPRRPAGKPSELESIARSIVLGTIDPLKSPQTAVPSDATASVLRIACDLLRDLRSSAESPTLRESREKLDRIEKAIHDLRLALTGLSGPVGLTQIVAMECGFFRPVQTEKGIEYQFVDGNQIFPVVMNAITKTTHRYKADLSAAAPGGAGFQRLHERLYDDPRLHFAESSTRLLQQYRHGREGRVPPNSDVLELMERIWKFATGTSADIDLLRHAAHAGAKLIRAGARRRPHPVTLRGLIVPKIVD